MLDVTAAYAEFASLLPCGEYYQLQATQTGLSSTAGLRILG